MRGVFLLVGLAIAFLIYKAGASFLPRWWAQHVGDQVKGRFSSGTMWGLFYGFVFTCVPALVVFQARRSFLRIKGRLAVIVLGLLLAAPNWLTLFVVFGTTNAAHAGERILDVEAPAFRWATFLGAVGGFVIAIALSGTSIWLKHRRHQVRGLKDQMKDERVKMDRAARDERDENKDGGES